MARIHLAIDDERKDDWEEYADEEYNGNLTQLIRQSVTKEMNGGHSPETADNTQQLASLAENQEQLLESFEAMKSRLESIESEASRSPEVDRIKGEVYDLLPDIEPGTEKWEREKKELQQEWEHTDSDAVRKRYQAWDGTVEGIASALEEPAYNVSEAIEKLQSDTQLVRETVHNDETRYYRRD